MFTVIVYDDFFSLSEMKILQQSLQEARQEMEDEQKQKVCVC